MRCEEDTALLGCSLLLDVVQGEDLLALEQELQHEVAWEQASHKGGPLPRLLAVQASRDDGVLVPVYRHPLDPPLPRVCAFSPAVLRIKACCEARVRQSFNHCLIQLYRDGTDSIAEHADKTLDIAHGSVICSYSIGATRRMRLKAKNKETPPVHVPLPTNSLFVLPLSVNRTHTHGIKPDRRADHDKRDDEHGARISITFRSVATFFSPATGKLSGQGAGTATSDEDEARQKERLLRAFSLENKTSASWEELYGGGFDCC